MTFARSGELAPVDVLVVTTSAFDNRLAHALARRAGRRTPDRGVVVMPAESVRGSDFDPAEDRHRVRSASGTVRSARVLVDTRGVEASAAYLGVADPLTPNRFLITADTNSPAGRRLSAAQLEHVRGCLALMDAAAATRITVRAGAADAFRRRLARGGECPPNTRAGLRRLRRVDPDDYELTNAEDRVDDEIYHGAATVLATRASIATTAHLTGHLDPRDGRFHWYGRLERCAGLDLVPVTKPIAVRIGATTATARITHRDPWGNLRVSGVGAPPYPLAQVVVTIPGAAATIRG